MSITQELFDRQIEHLIQTRRYSETARLLIEKESNRHRSFLAQLIRKDPKNKEAIQREVTRHVNDLYSKSRSHVNDFIGAEIDFQTNSLKRGVKDWYRVQSVNRTELSKAITGSPLKLSKDGEKGTMSVNFKNISRSSYTNINAKIRRGIAEGSSVEDIIKEVHKTTRLTEAQAKTLVTTNLTQAEQTVKEKLAEANADIISGFVFTAILDSRTSTLCSSTDGLFQTTDNINIRPPLHWNCRSSLVPVLKSKNQILLSDSKRVNKNQLLKVNPNKLPGGTPLKESFEEWLKRQSYETKKKYFDTDEKMALFEKGALNLSDFFSEKGNPISIAALRIKDNILTYYSPVRQIKSDPAAAFLGVSRPFQLVRSKKLQKNLKDLIIADAGNAGQPLSLTDYRGTSLAGKRGVRHRTNNEFDPRNNTFDPFTGEVRSTLFYESDFKLYRERIDYMKESKVLDQKQKKFIEEFVEDLSDSISVNQQSAVVENLRVTFERYNKNKVPWEDFVKVYRSEMNYSVVNTSRLLDRRSRARSELFLGFKGDPGEPSVSVMGEMIPLKKLQEEKVMYERFVRSWDVEYGRGIARKLYYSNKAPWRAYLFKTSQKPSTLNDKLIDSFKKRTIRNTFYKNDPVGFYTKYGKTPKKFKDIVVEHIKNEVKDSIPYYKFFAKLKTEGVYNFLSRTVREQYRSILDLEFLYRKKRKTLADSIISQLEKGTKAEDAIKVMSNLMQVVAEGKTTDYDSLAILLGKELRKKWPPMTQFMGSSLQDYHNEGSRILKFFQDQGMLRVNARGVTRRATVDLDTLRPSGNWKDTVSREVEILDKDMLKLQDYNRRVELSNRIGIDRPENKYYVVAGKKNYVDARGNDTGVPVITRSAYEKFDEKQLDKDFADMLNHTMNTEYEVDPQFSGFMDDLVRFKDQRGKAQYYDSINAFREEVIRRGDQGYGLMETIRYYRSSGRKFTANARIDGRGRVYYNGYLTPTGGETIRPFLNSSKATPMTPEGLHQIKIQMASVIGPGTEALTDAGRLAIFKRNEKAILRVGEIMSHTTQRDRRIREFLDDPFIRSIEGEEVAKIARFSLEYYRIHKHTGGDFSSGYNKTVFGESHSDYKITQQRVEAYNPKVVYHEFWEEPETIAWAKRKGYTLKPGDLSYAQKEVLMKKYGGATEQFHRYREAFMLKQIKSADPSVRNAFVFGNDHVFDKNSVINKTKNIRKIDSKGKVINAEGDLLSTYKTKLMGEADASASGLQVIALSTGNRGAAVTSNVIPTRQKNRIYDLVAMDVVADPRFQKMMDDLGLDLTWEDLQKAAKYQVMIAFYGAGKAGQAARVAVELSKVLRKKDITLTTRAEFLQFSKLVDAKIKEATALGADDVVADLKTFKRELRDMVDGQSDSAIGAAMLAEAEEIHPDVADLVRKYSNVRGPKVGPDHFKNIAGIMSEKLAERAPVTQTYITFWKRVAQDYAKHTKKVDIPWVTYDGKVLWQKYRPKVQQEIRFYDPESGRYVRNIYQMSAEDGKLLGKGSIGDVRLGFGVNGNHALDASLVRGYHLEGKKRDLGTATIHDAIFMNINELDEGIESMFQVYARARDFNNVKATLDKLHEEGLPTHLYRAYLREAEESGFMSDEFSSKEILRDLKPGESRYGFGP